MQNEGLSPEELELLSTPTIVSSPPNSSPPAPSRGVSDPPHPSLLELHRELAGSFGDELTEAAQRSVGVTLREQMVGSYAQFVFGQPNPTFCSVIRSRASELEFWFTIQPTVLYPLIDRLLGCRESDPVPQRPLSEIETALAGLLVERLIARYGEAWRRALSLELEVDRIATNVQLLSAAAGSAEVWRTRFAVRCGQDFGYLEVAFPWADTHQLRQRLAATWNQQ